MCVTWSLVGHPSRLQFQLHPCPWGRSGWGSWTWQADLLASGWHLPKQTQSWESNGHCQPGGLFLCPGHQTLFLLERLALFSEAVSSPSHPGQGAQVALVWSDLGAQGTPQWANLGFGLSKKAHYWANFVLGIQ